MSDTSITDTPATNEPVPLEEVTLEQKIQLLYSWKEKVDKEVADYTSERDGLMAIYRTHKARYDHALNKRMEKIKKIDGLLNGRKKVLMEVVKEIKQAESVLGTPPTEQEPGAVV